MIRFLSRLEALLLAACAGLFLLPLGGHALWDSDEGRYAEIAREMLAARDAIVPHLNGVLYFEKPPLAYWTTSLGLAVFGDTAFGARFFCVVFGLLTLLVVSRIGRFWKNERTGLLAAAILATSVGFFALTQYLVVDMALTFWMMLALYAIARLHGAAPEDAPSRAPAWILAAALAGGVLTKGLIALMPLVVWAAVAAWQGRWTPLRQAPWLRGAALFIVLAAPWFLIVTARHPFFASFFFIHEHVARYLTHVHQRGGPAYYFVPVLLVGSLPWTFFLPVAVWRWCAGRGAALRRNPIAALLIFWALFLFGFFSLSSSKLPAYMAPVFPALALLLAAQIDEAFESDTAPRWISWGTAALVFFLLAALAVIKWTPPAPFMTDPVVRAAVDQAGLFTLTLALCVLILVGVWGMRRVSVLMGGLLVAQSLLLGGLSALAPSLDPWLSTERLARVIQQRAAPQDRVIVYGVSYENYAQTLAFYTRRRIAVAGDAGELAMGAGHAADAAEWFAAPGAEADAFVDRAPVGSWIVTTADAAARLEAQDRFTTIDSSGRLRLLQKIQ